MNKEMRVHIYIDKHQLNIKIDGDKDESMVPSIKQRKTNIRSLHGNVIIKFIGDNFGDFDIIYEIYSDGNIRNIDTIEADFIDRLKKELDVLRRFNLEIIVGIPKFLKRKIEVK